MSERSIILSYSPKPSPLEEDWDDGDQGIKNNSQTKPVVIHRALTLQSDLEYIDKSRFGNDRGKLMHLGKRLAAVVLTLGLSAGLVGCGFHLKGTNPTAMPLVYTKLQLILPATSSELEKKLSVYLTATGVQLSNAEDAYVLRVLDYKPIRHELNGSLIEVLLRLSVTFQIEDRLGTPITEPRTVTATRTYQYNVATVNTDDQQNKYLSQILIDDIAQQMTRQIAANRLSKAQPNVQLPIPQNTPAAVTETK